MWERYVHSDGVEPDMFSAILLELQNLNSRDRHFTTNYQHFYHKRTTLPPQKTLGKSMKF